VSAKAAAHQAQILEAARVQALADASAARTWPISVHLTPFAPGCAALPIGDRRRWKTFYGRTVEQALRSVLTRLALPASACAVAQEGPQEIALLAPSDVERVRDVAAPHALFWDGVTLDQARTALAALTASGWKPPAAIPNP
jgi:hypothetical protein